MSERSGRLSEQAARVLRLIADGHDYSQIVQLDRRLTYKDIFAAAQEALDMDEQPSPYDERLLEIRRAHPRAYEKWSKTEDEELWDMHVDGTSVDDIAKYFQRQPSAIRSRLDKHRLLQESMGWKEDDD